MTVQTVPGWLLVEPAGADLYRVTGCARRSGDGSPVAWRVGSVVVLAVEPGLLPGGGLGVRACDVVGVVLPEREALPSERVDAALDRQLRGEAPDPTQTDPGGGHPARSPVPPAGTSPLAPTDVEHPTVLPPSGTPKKGDPDSQSLLAWVTKSQAGSRLRSEIGKLERDRGVAMWATRMKLTGSLTREQFVELLENVLKMPEGPALHERIKAGEELGQAVEDELKAE